MGQHSVAFDGTTYTHKNGIIKVPHPGLPHPEAHHLEHVETEDGGNREYFGAEAEKHQAIAVAEDAVKSASEVLRQAEEGVKAAKTAEDKETANVYLADAKALAKEAADELAAAKAAK